MEFYENKFEERVRAYIVNYNVKRQLVEMLDDLSISYKCWTTGGSSVIVHEEDLYVIQFKVTLVMNDWLMDRLVKTDGDRCQKLTKTY